MDRRTLLARLGAGGAVGLAGCGGPPTATGGRTTTATSTTPAAQRRIAVETVTDVPDEYALRVDVQVREARIVDTHTARIRLALKNEGAPREIPVSTERCALLNRDSQASTPRGVWLAPEGHAPYTTERGPRWTATPPENGAFPDYGCQGRRFASGAVLATEYGVFDDARAAGYLDPGRYRFERRLASRPIDGNQEPVVVDWGFVLSVADPGCELFC